MNKQRLARILLFLIILGVLALLLGLIDVLELFLPKGTLGDLIVIVILIPLCFVALRWPEYKRERDLRRRFPAVDDDAWTSHPLLKDARGCDVLALKTEIEKEFGIDRWRVLAPDMTIRQLIDTVEPANDTPRFNAIANRVMSIPYDAEPTPEEKRDLADRTLAAFIADAIRLGLPDGNAPDND